jgi:hypothetical protein
MGKNKDLKKVIDDAGAGIQNAGKAIVDKVTDAQRQQAEKVDKRRDALYLENAHIGKEELLKIRKPIPEASPYAIWKVLEIAFLEGISSTKDEERHTYLKQEFILTAIEIHGGERVAVDARRACMALIETNFRNFKIKKNTGRAIQTVLSLADLALTIIPGLQNFKFFKNLKFFKKMNLNKLVAFINRGLPFLRVLFNKIDTNSPGVQAAKRTIEQVQSKLGPVPTTWIVGETNV